MPCCSAGITVAIGLLALVVLPVPFMRSIGFGGALIPLASVLVTLTLTPAILGSIGPRVDWPKIRHENKPSKGWTSWARLVVRHRWIAAGSALAVIGVLFAAFMGIKIGAADSSSLAHSGPAYDTLQVLKDGGVTTGALTPIEVLAETDKAESVAQTLGAVDGVTAAVVPTGAGASVDGQTVVVLIPDEETVNSTSVQVVRDVTALADDTDGVIGVTGLGNAQVDFLHAVYGNFPLVLLIISVLTYILLIRAFRSLLLPLKAVILNLVTLTAVFGLMVLFWQEGYGSNAVFGIAATGAVTFWIPLMVFAFLFGLSMDYEVFILSRIREEYDGGASTDDAVIMGIGRDGPSGHQRGADPVPRLRRAGVRAGHRHQGDGDRPRLRHPARRHRRPVGAGAVAGLAVRGVELDAPGLGRADPPGRAVHPPRGARTRARPGR